MLAVHDVGDKPVPGYQLVKFLGRGGFGQVWKARAPGGTEVALKLIDLQGHQGFKEFRAIRLVKRIRHPNLAPILAYWLKDQSGNLLEDLGHDDSGDFTERKPAELIMAMGLGDKNLLDRLEECKKEKQQSVPVLELLKYMEAAADAIDFLNSPTHDLGQGPVAIQHGDIKPQNILIVGGAAQVCDFGLASVLGDARSTNPTASFAYVAPETLDNQPTKWTDQYSLAISYYELRTGELPFAAGNMPMILRAHAEGRLNLGKLTPVEQAVIKRATDLTPSKRYPTTAEMVKALRRAVEGTRGPGPVTAGPDGMLRLQPGVEIVPGYKLVQFLGGGSYGKVWEAAAPGGIHVALKVIEHLSAASGKQEFKALELIKRVEHNHLMDLLAYWLLDGDGQVISDEDRARDDGPQPATLIIACKLAKKNLAQRLKECLTNTGQGIPPLELLRYMRQAAKAIDHLNLPQHQLDDEKVVSIQHRDIKPENILLAGDAVKVADFGLAKIVEGTSALVHTGSAGLTLVYAAPEMFENKVTQWTDQYSLAITYYHLRTGTLPFDNASSPNEIISAHLFGKLDLSRVAEAERQVVMRATSTLPESRYPNCVEMVEALYHAVFGTLGEDDSFLLERAAESAAASAAVAPPRQPASPSTPTKAVTAAILASLSGPVSASREKRVELPYDETMAEGFGGTLHPGKTTKTVVPPKVSFASGSRKWFLSAIAAAVLIVGSIVSVLSLLGPPRQDGGGVTDNGTGPTDSTRLVENARPVAGGTGSSTVVKAETKSSGPSGGFDIGKELQRAKEQLTGDPQSAFGSFTNLLNDSSLILQQRRAALLGQARAAARLKRTVEVDAAIAELAAEQFEQLPRLPADDDANFAALKLVQKARGLAPEPLLESLLNFRNGQAVSQLGDWEKKALDSLHADLVAGIAAALPEKTPAEAVALAKKALELQSKVPVSFYQALAESVLGKRQLPADNEADLDSQLSGLFELLEKARVDEKDRDQLAKLESDVAAKDIEWRCPFADSNTDWKSRLLRCKKATRTGWVQACMAESRLESGDADFGSTRTEAVSPDVDATGDYGKYVRARVWQAEGDKDKASKELYAIDFQSPWFAALGGTPKYRGCKSAEILFPNYAVIRDAVRNADLATAKDPNLGPETRKAVLAIAEPVIQRLVRARAFDPKGTAQKLEAQKLVLAHIAVPLGRRGDEALRSGDLDTALDCALGFKAFGGDTIEAARLLGQVYAERKEYLRALRAFNDGLPPEVTARSASDLGSLTPAYLRLLMQRTYLIVVDHNEIPPAMLPAPETVMQLADRAVMLAPDADKPEALGAAGWAYHYAASERSGDERRQMEVGEWRLAAIKKLLDALTLASTDVKDQYGWKWQQLIGMQVVALLKDPQTAKQGEAYRATAMTQLDKALERAPEEDRPEIQRLLDRLKKQAPSFK